MFESIRKAALAGIGASAVTLDVVESALGYLVKRGKITAEEARDPSIVPPVRRALIVITIFGEKLTARTLVVPYYPLPASLLADEMKNAGFVPTQFPAFGQFTGKLAV